MVGIAGILVPGGARELGRHGGVLRHQLGYAPIPDHAGDAVAVQEGKRTEELSSVLRDVTIECLCVRTPLFR